MLTKINNISFQGKFTTPMQGRNGILKDIPTVFERKTKGLKGSLELAKENKVLSFKYNNKKIPFNLSNYGDITGAYLEKKTPEAIENIAESLARLFRIIKAQASYEKVEKKLKRTLSKTESALSANKKSYEQSKLKGENRFNQMYIDMIKKNTDKINEIESISRDAQIRYLNFITGIAGEDIRAQQYIKTLIKI